MDIIKMARELGKVVQQDADYLALLEAKKANDEDAELQKLIEQFNLLAATAEYEEHKEGGSEEKLAQIGEQMQDVYNQVMSNPTMNKFNQLKEAVDEKMNVIVAILAAAVNGEDPETFDPYAHEGHSCGGDCSHCHGC